MKLVELEPRKVEGGGFSFLCPKCRKQRIVCRHPWKWDDEPFDKITVQPSLNANPDHAHFEIIKGEIVMSAQCGATCGL